MAFCKLGFIVDQRQLSNSDFRKFVKWVVGHMENSIIQTMLYCASMWLKIGTVKRKSPTPNLIKICPI